jgi:hypothetical protein
VPNAQANLAKIPDGVTDVEAASLRAPRLPRASWRSRAMA